MPKARDDIIEAIAARKAEEEIAASMTRDERRLIDGREDDSRTTQPQISPAPPAKKAPAKKALGNFTSGKGAWEDEYVEDVDQEGAGDPLKPQGNRKRKSRDAGQSPNDQLPKKKRKRKKKQD